MSSLFIQRAITIDCNEPLKNSSYFKFLGAIELFLIYHIGIVSTKK